MAADTSRYANKMRRGAVRRSREINVSTMGQTAADIPPEPAVTAEQSELKVHEKATSDLFSGLYSELNGLTHDSDKLLIAAILLMLLKEGGDKRLILALGYILI